MSKADAVVQHPPHLRRYARALTGNQVSGDSYVALLAMVSQVLFLNATLSGAPGDECRIKTQNLSAQYFANNIIATQSFILNRLTRGNRDQRRVRE
jgi:hypothetical protein